MGILSGRCEFATPRAVSRPSASARCVGEAPRTTTLLVVSSSLIAPTTVGDLVRKRALGWMKNAGGAHRAVKNRGEEETPGPALPPVVVSISDVAEVRLVRRYLEDRHLEELSISLARFCEQRVGATRPLMPPRVPHPLYCRDDDATHGLSTGHQRCARSTPRLTCCGSERHHPSGLRTSSSIVATRRRSRRWVPGRGAPHQ